MDISGQKVVYLDPTEDGYEGQLENGTRLVFMRIHAYWWFGVGKSFGQAYQNVKESGCPIEAELEELMQHLKLGWL